VEYGEERRRRVLYALARALQPLLGAAVEASVMAADAGTLARFSGELVCAQEPFWRAEGEQLVVEIGAGALLVRVDQVERIEQWFLEFGGRSFANVDVVLVDGLVLLIHEDLSQAFR
jgi:hypothetical protein